LGAARQVLAVTARLWDLNQAATGAQIGYGLHRYGCPEVAVGESVARTLEEPSHAVCLSRAKAVVITASASCRGSKIYGLCQDNFG
jgi:hypothetical protein